MKDCKHCRFSELDYEEYYNSPDKQWFVCGCIKDLDAPESDDCEGYEETRDEQIH